MKTTKTIIWDVPAVDYITLTTFIEDTAYDILSALRIDAPEVQARSMAGYDGWATEDWFWGRSEKAVKGSPHFKADVKGAAAHTLAPRLLDIDGGKCTRIDIQVSIPLAETRQQCSQSAMLVDWVADMRRAQEEMAVRGRPVSVRLIDNGLAGGGNTVYVGSHKSDRFIRVYEKEGLELYGLRFEVQYREAYAREAWRRLRVSMARPVAWGMWLAEMERLPTWPEVLTDFMDVHGGGVPDAIRVDRGLSSVEDRITWISTQAAGALREIRQGMGDEDFMAWIGRLTGGA